MVVVEVELHSGASFHQVDIHILIVLSTFNWAVKHLHAFPGEPRGSCDPGDPAGPAEPGLRGGRNQGRRRSLK